MTSSARPPWWELGGLDAYELLGVAEDATTEEIVRAHRQLMKLWHTDTNDLGTAERKSRLLNCARTVLQYHRAAYDLRDSAPQETSPERGRRRAAATDAHVDAEPEDVVPDDPWDEVPDPWDEVPDPWDDTDTGAHTPPPPPPPVPWPPPAFVPGRAPFYVAPGAPFRPVPPPRRRMSLGRKVVLGFVITFWGLYFGAGALAVVAIAFSSDGEPEPLAAVSDSFAGTWNGTVKDADEEKTSWKIELKLNRGSRNGVVRYLDGRCTGIAVPAAASANRLTLDTEFPEGRASCDVGDIELALRKDTKLGVTYRDDRGKVTASGRLTR